MDGLSLPLLVLTAVIFLACAVYDWKSRDRVRPRSALFLFLEATCLGLFAAQDLILFFLFFDLSIVGMYFVIAGWGHGDRARSALKFFLYTFLGSLALLVGFIGLYLAADPHTFDIPELAAADALRGNPAAGFVLAAILVGLAVKTPTVPFHTWLPPAHTDAPATGSAVLAGVLLKMGTYGFVRIAMPLMPEAWRAWSPVIITVGNRVRPVRGVGGTGPERPQEDDRLYLRQPHGLHHPRAWCSRCRRGHGVRGPGHGGHRCRHADGQPRR